MEKHEQPVPLVNGTDEGGEDISLKPSDSRSEEIENDSTTSILAGATKRFAALFDGHDRFYGRYDAISTTPDEKGKLVAAEKDRATKNGAVTLDLYHGHLAGQNGLGIVPIRADATVLFGAVDVDVYAGLNHAELAHRIASMKLPLVLCRSKSGGAHCYLFSGEPIPAALIIARLSEVAAMLGHGGAEIFPKQKTPTEKGGSWINLPYFNGMLGTRYAVGTDGALSLEEFLTHAESLKQGIEWFHKPLVSSVDLPQGPPCLQHLVQIGFPEGTRNSGLFNLGVYCRKADPDNWKTTLEEMNQKYMQPQLDSGEVANVKKSVGKTKYFYTCDQQPIAAHCNRTICRTRGFGIGANGALPEFGQLKKIETDPPTWYWQVNEKTLVLNTPQLLDPVKFQEVCANKLNLAMPLPKRDVWITLLGKYMNPDSLVIEIPSEDSTVIGRFKEELANFCTSRVQGVGIEEIKRGIPFDSEDGYTCFRLKDLIDHLTRRKFNEFKLDGKEVSNKLRELKAVPDKQRMLGQEVRYWRIPSFSKQSEGFRVLKSVTEPEERPF
jgi:hypothetical protein